MRMADPLPTFTYLVEQFKQRFPNLAYLHVVSPNALANEGPKDSSVSSPMSRLVPSCWGWC